MSNPSTPTSRFRPRILLAVILLVSLLLAYPAYRWMGLQGAPAPTSARPVAETQMTLTPAEEAEFESNLYALMPRLAMKDATIEKIYKDGKGFVMVVKSGNVRMTLRMDKDPQQEPPAKAAK